ncbi:MAG: DUF6457 domain-containing protein [Streptosporangiaceae bacterium]
MTVPSGGTSPARPPATPGGGQAVPSRGGDPPSPPAPPGGGQAGVDRWIAAVGAELGLDPADVPVRAVLDLARSAAHQVERPAAPLTAFMLGLAVWRGSDLAGATARIELLAEGWPAGPDGP